jgi:hypothetical protein
MLNGNGKSFAVIFIKIIHITLDVLVLIVGLFTGRDPKRSGSAGGLVSAARRAADRRKSVRGPSSSFYTASRPAEKNRLVAILSAVGVVIILWFWALIYMMLIIGGI